MLEQSDLFAAPIARQTDPATSKRAARAVTETGLRRKDAELLLAAIRAAPHRTALEYAQFLIDDGLPWFRGYQVASKRTSDLHKAGLIRPNGERICLVSGRAARTWVCAA